MTNEETRVSDIVSELEEEKVTNSESLEDRVTEIVPELEYAKGAILTDLAIGGEGLSKTKHDEYCDDQPVEDADKTNYEEENIAVLEDNKGIPAESHVSQHDEEVGSEEHDSDSISCSSSNPEENEKGSSNSGQDHQNQADKETTQTEFQFPIQTKKIVKKSS